MNVQTIFDKLFKDYPALDCAKTSILQSFDLLLDCYNNGGKTLCCGNGGSAADSEHIVGELMKGFNLRRPLTTEEKALFNEIENGAYIADKLQSPLRSIALTAHSGLISAFANDVDPALVFAQQVWGYADAPTDVLIALSTSGNSKNVVEAAKTAKVKGIRVLSITGRKDSKLTSLSDICIQLPAYTPYEVQELTLPVYHALCAALEAKFFTE
ncbi:MAG: SIS domain-containing protein [Ruminococcaceae bacterium]|nr:SIS domain-containing protein [Oscillospiraceae bacterium]